MSQDDISDAAKIQCTLLPETQIELLTVAVQRLAQTVEMLSLTADFTQVTSEAVYAPVSDSSFGLASP